jgi:hypothetical protein
MGTFARGVIGNDTVDLSGTTMYNQYFVATNTSVMDVSAAGMLGLGFPVNK